MADPSEANRRRPVRRRRPAIGREDERISAPAARFAGRAILCRGAAVRVVEKYGGRCYGTGTCRAGDVTAPLGMATADGALAWRMADGSTAFALFAAPPPGDPACFPTHAAGDTTYAYDLQLRVLQLRVDWLDAPGEYRARIVFEAATA